eukprot:1526036-Amphidinium_carterae.2
MPCPREHHDGSQERLHLKEVVVGMLSQLLMKAVGKSPTEVKSKIVFYDPGSLKGKDLPKKGKFPFRENTFGVGPGLRYSNCNFPQAQIPPP